MSRMTSANNGVVIDVPLSKLIPGKRNPRRVKPAREAHRRMVALLRSQGLLQPLVVRPAGDRPKCYIVIAGSRRLAGLKEIHRQDGGDPNIPCVVRDVDASTADALSLGENFAREAMHPLDEAEAFARLATQDGKDAAAIAAEFGVSEQYVRQRMKLATLAGVVKEAYRLNEIDTGTAEAFASVPPDRQAEVWREIGGKPQHAHHVRNVIAHAWIDAALAEFDLAKLPEGAVSRDLFSDKVLVERKAFMEAQADALLAERTALAEAGWSEVVAGTQADIQDRLWSMAEAPFDYDPESTGKLRKLSAKREKLESQLGELEETDEEKAEPIQNKIEETDAEARAVVRAATAIYSEATKSVGTAFLILDADGRVRREYRVSRRRNGVTTAGGNGHGSQAGHGGGGEGMGEAEPPLTPDELKDGQKATTFTHQALAVREAVLKHPGVCRRVLAMILHEKVRGESLAIRHEANGTTLHADNAEGFTSPAFEAIRKRREAVDPFIGKTRVKEEDALHTLKRLSDKKLEALIDLLTVECITAHLQRRTDLVWRLARELEVNVRSHWHPDEAWLSGYQKIQLAALVVELRGSIHAPAETKKKSELVTELSRLFTDAAEGRIEDAALAAKLNGWLPANLREDQAPAVDRNSQDPDPA